METTTATTATTAPDTYVVALNRKGATVYLGWDWTFELAEQVAFGDGDWHRLAAAGRDTAAEFASREQAAAAVAALNEAGRYGKVLVRRGATTLTDAGRAAVAARRAARRAERKLV